MIQTFTSSGLYKTSLVVVAAAGAAFLLWIVRDGILVIFSAIIAAILLRMLTDTISRWTHLSDVPSLMIATLVIGAAILVGCWLFGTRIASEFSDVLDRATAAWTAISQRFEHTRLAAIGQHVEQNSTPMIGNSVRQGFSMLTEGMEALVVLVVSAIYLAAEPRLYRAGIVKLFKPDQQEHAGESLDILGRSMRSWLLGQLFTMLLVGVLSCVAATLIGLPGPLALGLIAFLTEAIPYLGPFLGGIPAVLVASTKGLETTMLTAGAYLLIHIVEGYFCAPLIQRYFVSIPPALMLFGIMISKLLFGTPGLLVAAPLTVAIFTIVKVSYLQEMPGEDRPIGAE